MVGSVPGQIAEWRWLAEVANTASYDAKHQTVAYVELAAEDLEVSTAFLSDVFGWTINDYGSHRAGIRAAEWAGEIGGLNPHVSTRTGGGSRRSHTTSPADAGSISRIRPATNSQCGLQREAVGHSRTIEGLA
ncbi:hypothetical protein GCM10011492_41600 [Flexivirga endophytica]|uniref:Uncharacterized protein n=1 Tax=Flexivirga endophytica TaxID=1849103 RepID=A0A916THQ9_9MICO|nr:hypothetical protein GCM10011492_41600 [Flexivirga endophytica]GHB69857.1 hypothetical protein GCM10008112_42940 [Flexivirga endophytica]